MQEVGMATGTRDKAWEEGFSWGFMGDPCIPGFLWKQGESFSQGFQVGKEEIDRLADEAFDHLYSWRVAEW
jgi:hypothetical protein